MARHPAYRLSAPINFVLAEGEQLAIYGPNGCGKTKLVNTIIGRYPLLMNEVRYDFGDFNHRMVFENIHYLAFRDSYGDADTGYYYQQRWHSQDVELSPTVRSVLPEVGDDEYVAALYRDFGIEALLGKQLVMLSSGELRRLQIVKALMTNPRVLIMDNPFIGLDAQTRTQLTDLLQRLIAERGLQLILVVSRREDIPNFVTRIETLSNPPGEGENSTCAVSQVLPHRANKAEENQLNVDLCRYEGSAVLCTTGARRDLGGSSKPLLLLFNKCDQVSPEERAALEQAYAHIDAPKLFISAKNRMGLEMLENLLVEAAALPDISQSDVIVTNARHYEALTHALDSIHRVQDGLQMQLSGDFVSQDLRECIHHLSDIVGEVSTDSVLQNIFKHFCIGK